MEFMTLESLIKKVDDGALIGIGAVPYMGLTSLMVNIFLKTNIDGKVLFFPLENLKKDIEKRAQDLNIKYQSFNKEVIELQDLKFEETINEIERIVISDNDVKVVLIDYLELMGPREFIHNITRKLKKLAIRKKVIIIITSIISRNVSRRKDKRPKLSDFNFFGGGDSNFDQIIFIYRDEYYNAPYVKDSNEYGVSYIPKYSKILPEVDAVLIIEKNRLYNRLGIINLKFDRRNGNYFFSNQY